MDVIKLKTDDGTYIYVEVSEQPNVVSKTSEDGLQSGADKAIDMVEQFLQVGDTIATVCQTIEARVRHKLKESQPTELELQFGVKLAGKAGIPLVTEGSVEGTFQVTAKWDFTKTRGTQPKK